MSVLPAWMYVHHLCAWCHWRSEESMDLLELWMVVNLYVDALSQTQVLCKSKYSKPLSHLSRLKNIENLNNVSYIDLRMTLSVTSSIF